MGTNYIKIEEKIKNIIDNFPSSFEKEYEFINESFSSLPSIRFFDKYLWFMLILYCPITIILYLL